MIEPYDPADLELEKYRFLIKACTLAWNMAVVEQFADHGRPQVRDKLARMRARVARTGFDSLLRELQERKVSLFPEDRRFIVETAVQPLESGRRRITVGSTPLENVVGTANAPVENPPREWTRNRLGRDQAAGRRRYRTPVSTGRMERSCLVRYRWQEDLP